MNRSTVAVVGVVLTLAVAGVAVWWFSQGTEAPSVDVTAPPVVTTTSPNAETTSTAADEPAFSAASTYALTDASRATFTIDEELRGAPTTVVGISTIVLGELLFDTTDPASLQIGTILVNARDFTTDNSNRNRAIRGPILDADSFEFIEFTPTAVGGLGGDADQATFTVTGDLSIRGVTNPVTFEVTAVRNSDGTLSGTAVATVNRTDWGLNIPSAPGVANVSESVTLTLEFEAAPAP